MAIHCCATYPCPICHGSAIAAAEDNIRKSIDTRTIVETVIQGLYNRRGFYVVFDSIEPDIYEEMIKDLVKEVDNLLQYKL
jgi:hypothetical protein